jgi:ABC-type transport system involved in cytochrome c biogenesis permease subunit
MISRISIVCFAASYAVVLAMELSRLLFRSGVRGAIMVGFAAAGLLAHTLYLAHRAAEALGPPLSSERDWCLVAAWLLVAFYLYLVYYHPQKSFGVFLLPMALGLIAAGRYLGDERPFARDPASQVWGAIHGTAFALTTVAVLVGFAAGLMYLRQARRLKLKLSPGRGLRLPSLEWLQRVNARALVFSIIVLAVGVLSGAVLNLIRATDETGRLPWRDPLVLGSGTMLVWLAAAALWGRVWQPAAAGRKVAYLTLVSFVLLVGLVALLLLNTQHGGRG